ncbi:MAG: glutamate--tRNA ligase [Candidatus Zambryskibacteria bacterium]|nr:glutamate--tRNA ligase [Candidatus Zambryskibacteria bacterium]
MNGQKVIVRFPPSPTGPFHVGNARTFLFNYLFAKQKSGSIAFRLEDTDSERSKKEYADDIIENLKWLGIEPDFDNIVKQSERKEIYKKYLQKLLDQGKAYLSKEAEIGEGQREEVIRFKNPNKKIKFSDLVRGEIEFETNDLGDFVIAKSLEEPVYHLAVVVDDFEMGVTHIIRGEDGISNTPRQILIQEAIGAPRPIYAHLPIMLATDKTKLSKRKHGEKVSVSFYREAGYLSQAMINFLALVGWNPGTNQEIFSMEELIKKFDITKVQKGGAIFNVEKLNWLNREYILHASHEFQISNLKFQINKSKFKNHKNSKDENFIVKFLKIMLDRIYRWGEVKEILNAGEFDYLFEEPELDKSKICWQKETPQKAAEHLNKILEFLENNIKIIPYAEEQGKGDVLWPLRYALSGKEKSPDPFTLIDILSPETSQKRIKKAIEILEK